MKIIDRLLPRYIVKVAATSTAITFSTETIPFQKVIVREVVALTSGQAKNRGIEEAYIEADKTHYCLDVRQTTVERVKKN